MRISLQLLWGRRERNERGPKRGLTVERIVTAAIELADAEGLDAASMRRVADRLGVGAMSLYRYVPGKTELLELMLDTIHGEDRAEAPTGNWREQLAWLARRSRARIGAIRGCSKSSSARGWAEHHGVFFFFFFFSPS